MSRFRRHKKGFTLIELIVVIAIIGILSMIATVSVMSIMQNNEKKAAKTSLTNYWKLTAQSFDRINLGFSTVSRPTVAAVATSLGLQTNKVKLTTAECTSLKKGEVHIQYTESTSNLKQRFQVKRITINYEGKYYYTDDGKSVHGPKDSLT